MGVFSRLFKYGSAGVTKSVAGVPAQSYMPVLGSIASTSGVSISQATAMTCSAVYACVTYRSEDVARCAPGLWRPNADGSRTQITDHPVAKLFKRPNRVQCWFEFVMQMHAALLLRGNAYAVILRDSRGNPVELIPVNPDAVMVLEASDGQIFYSVNRVGLFQIAVLRDFPQSIPAEDIFHLRGLAFNAIVGASTIGLARDSIGIALGLEQQAARWIKNGAFMSILLKSAKTLTADAANRLKTAWSSLFSGIENVGATAVLEDGIEPVPLKLTSVELQFIEQRKLQAQEVARFYRMPAHKLGLMDNASKMNLPQADQDYVNNTIMPDLERWEQKFVQVFDLDREGIEVDFDESALLRADILTRINVGRLGTMSGLTKTNEWRKSEKLPPVPGGDEVRAPVNLAALGSDMTGTAPDGAGRPSAGEEPADSAPEA
jgi:HK97 family phage portal protein